MPPTYSLVVPIFNEEAVIPVLMRRLDALLETLDAEAEVILVDDGSKDTSAIVIEAKAGTDKRYRLIKLSRNFGHQIAITVGLDHSAGRAVIVMDADLQDPPEVALQMIAKWKEGYDVVSAERASRQGESRFKRATADLFYRLMGRLGDAPTSRNAGDFRLVDRKALDCFLAMPERDRFVRGMFAWIGFRQGIVTFDRPPRAAGESKYSLRKMIGLAANGILSFSDAPLRLALWAGGAVSALAFLYGLSVIGRWALSDPSLERGWSSTIVIIAALGGANMMMTGVIGLYVGRIYAEAKGRPLYIVERAVGFEDAPTVARRRADREQERGARR
jgi:polyisoprenyl-phosphate glycosyltransferase